MKCTGRILIVGIMAIAVTITTAGQELKRPTGTWREQTDGTAKWAGKWMLDVQASTFGAILIPGLSPGLKKVVGQTLTIEQTAAAVKLSADTAFSGSATPQSVHEEHTVSLDGSETLIGSASFSIKPINDLTFEIVSKLTTNDGTTFAEVSHFAVSSDGETLIETKTQTENTGARIRYSKSVLVFRAKEIDPPVQSVSTSGTLHIQLNGPLSDWLLGANIAPTGATAKVQVFEVDRDFIDERSEMIGRGFVKSVSYPTVKVLAADTVQVNGIGSHETTTLYVEVPVWTTVILTGPKNEVLYQKPLTKTLLVSRGLEFKGATSADMTGQDFRMVLLWSERTHEARLQLPPRVTRSILQTRQ